MRSLQTCGNLPRDGDCIRSRHSSTPDAVCKSFAFDQLEHKATQAIGLLDSIDRGDIRLVQGRKDSRLSIDGLEDRSIDEPGLVQDFDRNIAPELRVSCAIDLRHSATADEGSDLVMI